MDKVASSVAEYLLITAFWVNAHQFLSLLLEGNGQELEGCFWIPIGYFLSTNKYKYDELHMVMKTLMNMKKLAKLQYKNVSSAIKV